MDAIIGTSIRVSCYVGLVVVDNNGGEIREYTGCDPIYDDAVFCCCEIVRWRLQSVCQGQALDSGGFSRDLSRLD